VVDLAASGNQVVAVGGLAPTGAAQAWSSGNGGETWNAETVPADSRSPTRVVAWGDKFLVAGAGDFNCAHPVALQTWVRVAGATWAAAPNDPKFCVGGNAELAVHGQTAVMAGIGSGDVPFLWSSGDGLHWTDRPGSIKPDTAPQALIADGSGFTVFGSSPVGPWDAHSADGVTWKREPLPGGANVSIVAAFIRNSKPAVIAQAGAAVGVIFRDNAGSWQTQPADGLGSSQIARIVAVDGGLVALGGSATGPAVWVSIDGTSWRSVELPPGTDPTTTFSSALISGGRALLTGQASVEGHSVGVIWVGSATLLTP
jgi:hypothetical protein